MAAPEERRAMDGGTLQLPLPAGVSARGRLRRREGDRVLLVDDDAVARLLTASALAERGWRVDEVEGGEAALAAFLRHPYDVIVLDALMPGCDGFAACERLRRLPGGEHVPVLMLTGLEDESSIARAYEAGATDFFVKAAGQWTLLSERLRYLLRAARMREELAISQAKLTTAQRIARLGSWEWDRARRQVRMSAECFSIAGLPAAGDEVAGADLWLRVIDEERERVTGLLRAAVLHGAALDFECRIERPDGQRRTVKIEGEVDRGGDGAVIALHGVVQDVTERRQAEAEIRRLADFDSLTGLPNRRSFLAHLADSIERARPAGGRVAVLFIDVDRFKQINDTLGHPVGDELLREIGRRLSSALRGGDTVGRPAGSPERATVARLGGDEFTIVLSDLEDDAAVEPIVQRLLAQLRRPVQCGSHDLYVTASVGMALYPRDGDDAETLVRRADMAMYTVKDRGRDGWVSFDERMNADTAQRWRLESELHRAIERQELVLHYQPKVDVATGRIVGAEALMRWQHGGVLVPPGQFISVAEESGLIVPITEWAFEEVCRQLAAWDAEGVPRVPVSVNVSSRHVQRGGVIEPLERALARHGLPPARCEFELTETVLMQNLDAALPLLRSLKALGVSISIDDFGTGYSSLAYLKRLPIDTLKIDRSFVRELGGSSDGEAIVAAIIAMSRSLKLRVVAEGVETEAQRDWLHEQGCSLMQGFLFARPVPPAQFAALARATPGGRRDWRIGAGGRSPLVAGGPAAVGADASPEAVARRWAARFDGRGAGAR